jgi:hypothetical protein
MMPRERRVPEVDRQDKEFEELVRLLRRIASRRAGAGATVEDE